MLIFLTSADADDTNADAVVFLSPRAVFPNPRAVFRNAFSETAAFADGEGGVAADRAARGGAFSECARV